MVEIIATIGHSTSNIVQTIDHLISCNINSFRFNLSKFSDLSKLEKYIDDLIAVKQRYGTCIKIMLDIPYPYQKCRIYTDNLQQSVHQPAPVENGVQARHLFQCICGIRQGL